jgi:hypothetical protein
MDIRIYPVIAVKTAHLGVVVVLTPSGRQRLTFFLFLLALILLFDVHHHLGCVALEVVEGPAQLVLVQESHHHHGVPQLGVERAQAMVAKIRTSCYSPPYLES